MKYIYKTLPFIGDVSSKDRNIYASKASEQLTKLINSNAVSGWEFIQINTVNIYKSGESPGCLASLFGATRIADTTEKYDMVIFRKELSESDQKNIGEEMKKISDNFEDIDGISEDLVGSCPSCGAVVHMDAEKCKACDAIFKGKHAKWKPTKRFQ